VGLEKAYLKLPALPASLSFAKKEKKTKRHIYIQGI